ncbi:MAG: hypothetical protein R2939_15265 [Kofleriaceae bacterium]
MQARKTMGFSRDGRHGLVIAGGALHQVGLGAAEPARVLLPAGVAEVCAVGREIWAVHGDPPTLARFDLAGAPLGTLPLVGGTGPLRGVALGPLGAVWHGPPPSLITVGADGALASEVLPGDPDWAAPVTVNRWVFARGSRLALRDVTTERWSVTVRGTGRVVDGAVLLDGRSVALVLGAPGDGAPAHLAVHGLHDGAAQARLAVQGVDLVRFAPARGLALLRSGPRTLVLLDLRFGRVLREHTEPRDILDAAIDHDGQHFLVRFGDGAADVVVGSIRELLAERTATVAGEHAQVVANEDEAPIAPAASPAPEPPPPLPVVDEPAPSAPFHRGGAALGEVRLLRRRRSPASALPVDEAAALLGRHRDVVAALLGLAIARAWTTVGLASSTSALPFKTEVAGLLAAGRSLAAAEVAEAEARLAQAEAARRAARRPPPGRARRSTCSPRSSGCRRWRARS